MTLFTSVFSEVWNNLCVQHSYCNRNTASSPCTFEIQSNSNGELEHWHCHTFEQYDIPVIIFNTAGHPFFQQRKQNTQEEIKIHYVTGASP